VLQNSFGDYDGAQTQYETALEKDSSYYLAMYNLGALALEKRKDFETARRHFEGVLQMRPDYPAAHLALGFTFLNLFREEEARVQFERGLELCHNLNPDPDYKVRDVLLCQVYIQMAKFYSRDDQDQPKARATHEKSIEVKPDFALAHLHYASFLHVKLQEYQEARICYEKAIELSPGNAEAHTCLGELYENCLHDYDSARREYEIAIESSPDNESLMNLNLKLGVLFMGGYFRDVQAALKHFRRAVTINPYNPEAHLWFGIFFANNRDPLAARNHFEKALTLNPSSTVKSRIHQSYGALLQKSFGDEDSARHHFEKAIESDPANFWSYRSLAVLVLTALKDYNRAQQLLEKFLELQPDFAVAALLKTLELRKNEMDTFEAITFETQLNLMIRQVSVFC